MLSIIRPLDVQMINRVLQLMQPINDFIAFYKSPQGKKEFKGNKRTMVDITPKNGLFCKDWCIC